LSAYADVANARNQFYLGAVGSGRFNVIGAHRPQDDVLFGTRIFTGQEFSHQCPTFPHVTQQITIVGLGSSRSTTNVVADSRIANVFSDGLDRPSLSIG